MENLKNKTFIITGGGRGIGAEASKLIASNGANVILTCRTESQGISIEKEILNKINIKTVKYVDEILSETLENKIEPLIDIKPEIGQKIKNDQLEPSTQTH